MTTHYPFDSVVVIGPREANAYRGEPIINTTSVSSDPLFRQLSPFRLGPCNLYDGMTAALVENAWQYTKVWPKLLDGDGNPSEAYFAWARAGWASRKPNRYPMGRGHAPHVRPAYWFWAGVKLGLIGARANIYWPLYRDCVRETDAFDALGRRLARGERIVLFDFDGYDHAEMGLSLADAIRNEHRSLPHAFVLKALLLLGPDATFDAAMQALGGSEALASRAEPRGRPAQSRLF